MLPDVTTKSLMLLLVNYFCLTSVASETTVVSDNNSSYNKKGEIFNDTLNTFTATMASETMMHCDNNGALAGTRNSQQFH